MSTAKNSPLVWLALFAIYVIWGTTYLAGAMALHGLLPFVISALRYLAAGLLLAAWIRWNKIAWPDRKHYRVLCISGILMLSGGSGLVIVGEQYISSGAAAVIMATEPLFFILLDRSRWPVYFKNKWMIAGLLSGFAALTLFIYWTPAGSPPLEPRPLLGTAITLASAIAWVVGALYANSNVPAGAGNISNSAIQLIAAGLFSALVATFKGEWSMLEFSAVPMQAWGGLVYLILMGSLLAFIAFNWLITVRPPAVVSTHTYVNPPIAVLTGWFIAAEPVTIPQIGALVVVLLSVFLTQVNKA